MLYPTIDELTKGQYNRYELALATARCARLITDEYVRQHDVAEKSLTGNKETDRPINTMIDRELRDEKAVQVAINRIYRGAYAIDPEGNAKPIVVKSEAEELVAEENGNEEQELSDEAEAEDANEELADQAVTEDAE
jgi:hypothetical protein